MRLNMSVPRENMTPAGISGDLWFVHTRRDEKRTAGPRSPKDRTPRAFEVHCTFSRESAFGREIRADQQVTDGSSFFRLPDDAIDLIIQTSVGEFRFARNTRGEISGASWSGIAKSMPEARSMFLSGLTPMLDHVSYLANTPLILGSVIVHDSKHRTTMTHYTAPYTDVVLGDGIGEIPGELVPIFALYREAKNATSAFYRFLSYFKILEGIYRHLRPKVFKEASDLKVDLVRAKELLPDHEELRKFHPKLIGRAVKDFFDNELQAEYRDAVAHYLLDNGGILNPSDHQRTAHFANIMLPTELACRLAIEQQKNYIDQVTSVRVRKE